MTDENGQRKTRKRKGGDEREEYCFHHCCFDIKSLEKSVKLLRILLLGIKGHAETLFDANLQEHGFQIP